MTPDIKYREDNVPFSVIPYGTAMKYASVLYNAKYNFNHLC